MAGTTIPSLTINQAVTTEKPVQGESSDSSLMKIAATYTGLISLIGLMLNILIIAVIVILKDYKDTRPWYVLNLATANGLNLLMLLVSLQQGVTGSWSAGVPACVAFQGGLFASFYAGIWLLVVMSFDLYITIAHPVTKLWKTFRSRSGSLLLAGMMWGLAIAAAIPIMMNSFVTDNICDFSFDRVHPDCEAAGIRSATQCEVFRNIDNSGFPLSEKKSVNDTDLNVEFDDYYAMNGFYRDLVYVGDEMSRGYELNYYGPQAEVSTNEPDENEADCFPDVTDGYSTWILIKFLLCFVVPFTIMTCCYCGILYRYHYPSTRASCGSPNTRSDNNTSCGNSEEDGSVREIVFVASLVAAFVICWLPLHVVSLSRIHRRSLGLDACYKLRSAVVLLANSNSFVNPILCLCFGIHFRKKLKLLVSRLCRESSAQKMSCLDKKDTADSTKLPLSKPDVPLATIRSNQADANNDVVDIEAQTNKKTNRDQN